MSLHLHMITVDSENPAPLARWWAEQLDATIVQENEGWFVVLSVPGWPQALAFQKVEAVAPGKNRIHLDLGTANVAEKTAALVAAGATHVADHTMGDFGWTVLADPDGNQFCVAPEAAQAE